MLSHYSSRNIARRSILQSRFLATQDPYYLNTVLALHGEGTNASTTFIEEHGHVVTASGNAQISTTQKKFGVSSIKFDGAGDYLTVTPSGSDFVFGTGDFTIETQIYFSALTGAFIYEGRPASTNGLYVTFYFDGTHLIYMSNTGNILITGTATFSTSTWYHIALCRKGGVSKIFVNGVQDGSSYTDTLNLINNSTRPVLGISGFDLVTYPLNGYMDEFRVTKAARYGSTFTPPTSQFIDA